jgi:flagellar motor switch protein FliG
MPLPTVTKLQPLGGIDKAAILLISLGPEVSSKVLKHLRDDEIERISLQIASTTRVDREVMERVHEEFRELCMAQEYLTTGGLDYARDVLEKALGSQKANDVIFRLTSTLQLRPFEFVRRTDPSQLLNIIQGEHPQTIALIIAFLQPDQASAVLAALPPERQVDVARRVAVMDRTSPEIIHQVEAVLERKFSSVTSGSFAAAGGIGAIVEVLNRVDRTTEKNILEMLSIEDPELTDEIKRRMFLFEDILSLDDRSVQRVLRDVDLGRDLPLALKTASDELKRKILANMSKHAGENLTESVEFLGPVRLRDIEEAQTRIVNIVRKLEEEGEIIIARGGGDEIVV